MRALWTAACVLSVLACGPPPPDAPDATAGAATPGAPSPASTPEIAPEGSPSDEASAAACLPEPPAPLTPPPIVPSRELDAGLPSSCPDDMLSVDTTYCPDVERRCLDLEHDDINNLDICHAYAHQQRCRLRPRRIAFCIDRYEYPNRAGAHPTWMLDWYQAQATCESKGKRLCYASEWTAACEGPEHTPFPYGWERNHDRCNVDNFFIEPRRWSRKGPLLFYSKDEQVALGELTRLDQSVPSGSLEGCKSGFGVADMTGNVDEWVSSDVAPREKSLWAGLKGGAWGHVRSQCRPMTFSHDPAFSYYFVGFRCCQDAEGVPAWTPSSQAMRAPAVAPHDYAPDPVVVEGAPGPSRSKFSRSGRAE
jgi:sulfatase modifying factor 1